MTAFAALAIVMDWSTGRWTETLLVIGAITVIVAAGWIVIALAIAASFLATAYFFAPVRPPGLIRISTIIEKQMAERQAAAQEDVAYESRRSGST